jgi:hypothetical protein
MRGCVGRWRRQAWVRGAGCRWHRARRRHRTRRRGARRTSRGDGARRRDRPRSHRSWPERARRHRAGRRHRPWPRAWRHRALRRRRPRRTTGGHRARRGDRSWSHRSRLAAEGHGPTGWHGPRLSRHLPGRCGPGGGVEGCPVAGRIDEPQLPVDATHLADAAAGRLAQRRRGVRRLAGATDGLDGLVLVIDVEACPATLLIRDGVGSGQLADPRALHAHADTPWSPGIEVRDRVDDRRL